MSRVCTSSRKLRPRNGGGKESRRPNRESPKRSTWGISIKSVGCRACHGLSSVAAVNSLDASALQQGLEELRRRCRVFPKGVSNRGNAKCIRENDWRHVITFLRNHVENDLQASSGRQVIRASPVFSHFSNFFLSGSVRRGVPAGPGVR